MPVCCGWLRTPPTSSSSKKVLNVPQRARLRAFLLCILVNCALAQPRYEAHFVTRSKENRCQSLFELLVLGISRSDNADKTRKGTVEKLYAESERIQSGAMSGLIAANEEKKKRNVLLSEVVKRIECFELP
jgi:hypothetical protein